MSRHGTRKRGHGRSYGRHRAASPTLLLSQSRVRVPSGSTMTLKLWVAPAPVEKSMVCKSTRRSTMLSMRKKPRALSAQGGGSSFAARVFTLLTKTSVPDSLSRNSFTKQALVTGS